jgi:hypothetical protein
MRCNLYEKLPIGHYLRKKWTLIADVDRVGGSELISLSIQGRPDETTNFIPR